MKTEKLLKKYEDLEEDFEMLRRDYHSLKEDYQHAKKDLLRLLAILVEREIGIPDDIIDWHIQRQYSEPELPFSR